MNQPAPLVIQVLDSSSDPVDGAFLTFEISHPPLPEMALVTDAHGEVRMALPPGSYRAVARKSEYRGATDFQIHQDSSARRLIIVLRLAEAN